MLDAKGTAATTRAPAMEALLDTGDARGKNLSCIPIDATKPSKD
jgi:hypothetical protein